MSKVLMSLCSVVFVAQTLGAQGRPYLSMLPDVDNIASTIPANGDVNPYGVAIVPVTTGTLVADNILVSNFNNGGNLQGTGTTIVQVSPGGNVSPFAQLTAKSLPGTCPGGVGLTTALVALRSGFVIVGSLPTKDGTPATAQAGCLIILNSSGIPITTLSGNGISGPWDMAAFDSENDTHATLFVTNVLGAFAGNGAVVDQGTVVRIVLSTPMGGTPSMISATTIASGFPERTDPNALVIGPTGLALDANGTLFVADPLASRIAKIAGAVSATDTGSGTTVAQNRALNMPLGLAIAPNGDILTVNGGDGRIVETTPDGKQAAVRFIDLSHSRNGAGTLFGLAVARNGSVYFVDDGDNTLNVMDR